MIRTIGAIGATPPPTDTREEAAPPRDDLRGHSNGDKSVMQRPDDAGPGADEARAAREAADADGRRYRFLAKAIPQIIWTAEPDGKLDSFNPRWAEYTGLPARQERDRGWHRSLHPEDVRRWLQGWERARMKGERLELDLRLLRRDGSFRWHLARALPVRDRTGRILKWMGTCTDIDDQKRAEGMLGFLAEVSTVLASSLDYETTLAAVARMAVPHVADWCVIDMLEPDGTTRRLAVAHRDPAQVELGWELGRRYPAAGGEALAPARVLRTGRSEVVPLIDDALRDASAVDADHLALLRSEGSISSIAAALAARGRILGLITFRMAESGRRYSEADIPLVEDLARRAALAVDNARLYREARQAREEAEAANLAKDRFLAVLSHELRTPLTPVLAEVSALLDDPATPEAFRPVLEMTRRNVDLQARLIDDLLDLSRIAQGKLPLRREVVDAHLLISRALEICRAGIDEARLDLVVDLRATRHHVEADPARLQQVVWNLIKNATKFTPAGGVVAVRTVDVGEALAIEVADSGMGIATDVLSRIFDAFDQGDTTVTRRFGGLGLGLAISRGLAEAHGGRLIAASPGPSLGATFTLELPAVAAPAFAAAVPTATEPGRPGSLRLLLVEDNADTLRVMGRLLRGRGHQVATAASIAEAVGLADSGPFDLLISDLGLPDGSGLDLLRRLRTPPTVGAIALSGHGMDDDIRRSREAGFAEHLIKPVDFRTLEAAIARVARAIA